MPLSPIARSIAFGTLSFMAITSPLAAQDAPAATAVSAEAATSETAFDPEALSLASQIVDIGYPEESREALFFGTMDQTVLQMRQAIGPNLPQNDPGAMAIFDSWVLKYTAQSKDVLRKHIPSIMVGMTEAYAKVFTVKELTDILAFVETPSGKKFFELSPAVLGEPSFADANQRYLDESMELLGPAQQELLDDLMEYIEDQEADDSSDHI